MQLARLDYSAAFETKDWKTPRAAFESVLAVREKLGDSRGISETLFYLGLTYEQDGQPDPAFERYTKSLAIAEKEKNIILESYVRRHMAGIQEERGELDAARKNIDLEVELRRKGGFLVGVPFALRHKADFVAAHGPGKAEAVRILEEAASLAGKCGSTRGALPRADGPLAPRPRERRCEEGPGLRRAGRRDGETVRRALRGGGGREAPRRGAARRPRRVFVSLASVSSRIALLLERVPVARGAQRGSRRAVECRIRASRSPCARGADSAQAKATVNLHSPVRRPRLSRGA